MFTVTTGFDVSRFARRLRLLDIAAFAECLHARPAVGTITGGVPLDQRPIPRTFTAAEWRSAEPLLAACGYDKHF